MSATMIDVQARAAGEALGAVVAGGVQRAADVLAREWAEGAFRESSADGGGPLSPAQILREAAAIAARVADRLDSGEPISKRAANKARHYAPAAYAAVATIGEALGVWP